MQQLDVIKEELLRIAEADENAWFVCIDGFDNIAIPELKKKYPERTVYCGISEANALSVAAGLALHGKTVFVLIMGIYSSTRAFEQLRVDIGYNNANVKVLAFKPGMKYNADAGYSHWAIEDIALVRTIPHLTVFSASSSDEARYLLSQAHQHTGAYYLRIENLHSEFNSTFVCTTHQMNLLSKGDNVALITTGAMTEYGFKLVKSLKYAGVRASHYNVNTIKPFDVKTVQKLIDKRIPIVTLEDQVRGGVGSIVSEVIAEYGKKAKFMPVRIDKENFNMVGNWAYIMENLMSFSEVPNKIIRFIRPEGWRFLGFPILTIRSKIKKSGVGVCFYMLLGCFPLLKIKQRKNIHKGKPHFKAYLFGFLRLI